MTKNLGTRQAHACLKVSLSQSLIFVQMSEEKKSQESQNVSRGGGNTRPHRDTRSRAFTVTSFDIDSHAVSMSRLSQQAEAWIIGKEICPETKRQHLQCYFRFKNQKRFSTMKSALPGAHIETAKADDQANYKYCSKEGDFKTNITPKIDRADLVDMVLKTYNSVTWRPWQKDVLDIVEKDPDTRTVVWIFEPRGNQGKSFLAKFLCCRTGTVISSGKATDIFNQVNQSIEAGILPKLVICDVPRVCKDFVSYQAIEKLKDGCLYSGKYEGGVCLFPAVHVICFANQMPEVSKMSSDRWLIYEIKDNQLFEKLAQR